MPQSEFDIIEHYFLKQKIHRDDVKLGIGDDAAIVSVPDDRELVVALDTLVAGVHFPVNTSAEDIAYKALAVNLSDLAAMGAEPAWFTLALTLPESDSTWLADFAKGLFSLADEYHMQLIGGDTTQGPLTISVQVAGWIPVNTALRRDTAKSGDLIYVTGTLGDAALGLQCLLQADRYSKEPQAIERLNRPLPRVEVGLAIRDIATACIDISDGLLADIGHILNQSRVGASVDRSLIPLSEALQSRCNADENQYQLALAGGDDYELCFCALPGSEKSLQSIAQKLNIRITCIGEILPEAGLHLHHQGRPVDFDNKSGYEHFK